MPEFDGFFRDGTRDRGLGISVMKRGGIWLAGSDLGTVGAVVLLVREFVKGQDLARRFCLRNRGSGGFVDSGGL